MERPEHTCDLLHARHLSPERPSLAVDPLELEIEILGRFLGIGTLAFCAIVSATSYRFLISPDSARVIAYSSSKSRVNCGTVAV